MLSVEAQIPAGHIQELDGIRGIAVTLVLLFHFWPNVGGFWRAALPFTNVGWIGVDLFFVLSGFLITGILLDSRAEPTYYSRFYLRRAFRIFPLYYTFLILTFLFIALWHGGSYMARLRADWGSPAWFFFYLANFVSTQRGTFAPFASLGPMWSLQIEEQFYICFPFLVRRLGERLWVLLIALMVGALSWRVFMLSAFPANSMIQYAGTLSRADALAAGALAAFILRYLGRKQRHSLTRAVTWLMPVSLCALVAMYCCFGTEAGDPFIRTVGYSLNAAAFSLLILWIVQRQDSKETAVFRLGPVRWLGKVSYCVYLAQLSVQSGIKLITGTPLGSPERTPSQCMVWLIATLLVAWLSWMWFEKPVRNWGILFRFSWKWRRRSPSKVKGENA